MRKLQRPDAGRASQRNSVFGLDHARTKITEWAVDYNRPALEVADILRRHGGAYREINAGHLSRGQLKVMGAVRACRTAALGGHVERCGDCGHSQIAYNSCRNRHCPKCQAGAAHEWLEARQADLLPVEYFHIVFTLPAPLRPISY